MSMRLDKGIYNIRLNIPMHSSIRGQGQQEWKSNIRLL